MYFLPAPPSSKRGTLKLLNVIAAAFAYVGEIQHSKKSLWCYEGRGGELLNLNFNLNFKFLNQNGIGTHQPFILKTGLIAENYTILIKY